MGRKLTIVVISANAVGHVNACVGALSGLLSRGHRVIFILEKAFEGKLKALGYEEYLYSSPMKSQQVNGDEEKATENPGEKMAQILLSQKVIGPFSALEKMKNMLDWTKNPATKEDFKKLNDKIKKSIVKFTPDVFYVDGFFYPAVYFSKIPWIMNVSLTPIFISDNPKLPPGGSGLPADDPSEWEQFAEIRKKFFDPNLMNSVNVELGYEAIPDATRDKFHTQMLTVYSYPEELNYQAIREEGWFNLEVFNKTSQTDRVKLDTLLPKEFLNSNLNGKFSGKLIYVSMGSMGCVDLDLMNRLCAVLGKTDHKYIVSKGPRFEEYQLAANMWGSRYLPQTKIVPHVDLVITHGGNNTVTEVFSEGKPMIVLPLFGDQFDNAQRLKETGLGDRIDPYNFTDNQLVDTIDRLLKDNELKDKLQTAARRIQQSNKHELLAVKIEQLIS